MALINLPPIAGAIVEKDGRVVNAVAQWFMQVFRACSAVYESGTTANRPVKDLWIGRPFFDVTLNRPIWWAGSNWIRADGVVV